MHGSLTTMIRETLTSVLGRLDVEASNRMPLSVVEHTGFGAAFLLQATH